MTTVHISLGRDDGTDQTAAKGVVEWEPTTRREDGTMVILERGFVAPLVDGEATVIVDPSGLTWCWRVTERTDSGGTVRYVSVPDSAVVVEYVSLPDVDPTTLVAWSPADPEAAYQQALENLDVKTAVENYLLANPVSAPVDSVNGQTGAVALDAADVGADPAGTAQGLVDTPQTINAQTAAYTLVAGDAGKLVTMSKTAAMDLTIPKDVFSAGQRVDVLVINTGMVTVKGATDVTVTGTPSLVSRAQWSALTVICTAANTFVAVGDLATP